MASFTGTTRERAEEILGESVVSSEINEAGHLIMTRGNGSTFDAGDFTAIVGDILASSVATAVATAVPNAVAGTFVDKGNVSGAINISPLNTNTLVNAYLRLTATGDLTFNITALPSSPKVGTQFALKITQDATGNRTLTLTGFKKSMGTLVLSTAPAASDLLVFFFDGTSWIAGLMAYNIS